MAAHKLKNPSNIQARRQVYNQRQKVNKMNWTQKQQIKKAGRPPGPCCELCGCVFSSTPHYDHNHQTGEFRGWICRHCNTGLGMFGDSPSKLESAINYLQSRGYYGIKD